MRRESCQNCGGEVGLVSGPCAAGKTGSKRSLSLCCVGCDARGALVVDESGEVTRRLGPLFRTAIRQARVVTGP